VAGALQSILMRRGLRKGVLGDSRAWFGVWAALTALRLVRRVGQRQAKVETISLRPGQALVVHDLGVRRRDLDATGDA
jgi:hypothetical protein